MFRPTLTTSVPQKEMNPRLPKDTKTETGKTGNPIEKAFQEFNEWDVDILSEEIIQQKLKNDLPTCPCGGHCICRACMTIHKPILTQRHCSGKNAPAPENEFICIRDFTSWGEQLCHVDGVGCVVCIICLTHGPDHPTSDPPRLLFSTGQGGIITF